MRGHRYLGILSVSQLQEKPQEDSKAMLGDLQVAIQERKSKRRAAAKPGPSDK